MFAVFRSSCSEPDPDPVPPVRVDPFDEVRGSDRERECIAEAGAEVEAVEEGVVCPDVPESLRT